MGGHSHVIAFHQSDGSRVWKSPFLWQAGYYEPAVGYGKVFIAGDDDQQYFLSEKTGALIGGYNSNGSYSAFALGHGSSFVCTKNDYVDGANELGCDGATLTIGRGRIFETDYSVLAAGSLQDGSVLWKIPFSPTPFASPALANHVLYAASGDHLDAFRASTGELLWNVNLGSQVGSPIVAERMVFISTADGVTHAFGLPASGTSP
jgi:outer membrane protein assembly factor BamB